MIDRVVNRSLYILRSMHDRLHSYYFNTDSLPKVVFAHVPKCGGTSICRALGKIYKKSYHQIYHVPVYKASKSFFKTQKEFFHAEQFSSQLHLQLIYGALLFNSAARERKCLSGHIYFNREMIRSLKEMDYKFITLIRNPVDRIFSDYFYNYYRVGEIPSISVSFQEYIDNRHDLGSFYIKFFGGLRSDNVYDSEDAISRAIYNLKEYEIIGRLENLADFVKKIEKEMGFLLEIPKVNKNPAPKTKYNEFKSSSEKREMVEEICQPDLKLIKQIERMNL